MKYDNCNHALCGAHHLRDLEYIFEQYNQIWAQDMKNLLIETKEKVDTAKEHFDSLDQSIIIKIEQKYQKIIDTGYSANPPPEVNLEKRKRGRPKRGEPLNLLDRFKNHQKEVLAFMYDFKIPFDNNLAERDVRMMKLQIKLSGTFRTILGAQMFCRIRGFISTMKKQNRNVLDSIMASFNNQPVFVT